MRDQQYKLSRRWTLFVSRSWGWATKCGNRLWYYTHLWDSSMFHRCVFFIPKGTNELEWSAI